ncbi:SDR family oxidoreductase [Streptomyces sp. NPDC005648]|uniref:SDR family oxidoreductase n=1 Tax=Streptomyces sp. NPDC005648 TaxID=3157044 RepID=UPI0033BB2362
MKVVVIGGTGLIGSKVVALLREQGHEAVAAAPGTGVDTLTGQGLAEALKGASVVVDVSNSPSFEDEAVMEFFRTSTTNILKAEAEAGTAHHVALSVVGTDRLLGSGYFRAKQVQEDLIKASGIPCSIVHATQFFEFAKGLADGVTEGDTVRLPAGRIQPIVSDDVAAAVARTAVAAPVGGVTEVAGPEAFELEEFIRMGLGAQNDPRKIVTDPRATYWGAPLEENTLLPGPDARLAETRFADWLARGK